MTAPDRIPSPVRAITQGEYPCTWNVFHTDPADDRLGVVFLDLSPECQQRVTAALNRQLGR